MYVAMLVFFIYLSFLFLTFIIFLSEFVFKASSPFNRLRSWNYSDVLSKIFEICFSKIWGTCQTVLSVFLSWIFQVLRWQVDFTPKFPVTWISWTSSFFWSKLSPEKQSLITSSPSWEMKFSMKWDFSQMSDSLTSEL